MKNFILKLVFADYEANLVYEQSLSDQEYDTQTISIYFEY